MLSTSLALKWMSHSIPHRVTYPGTAGPGMPQTLEWIKTKVKPCNASARPTHGNLERPKVSTTDLDQLSTQGRYLVVAKAWTPFSGCSF